MRFKCRKTQEELEAKAEALRSWHDCFTWFPREVGGICVWLETIERRFPKAIASKYQRKVILCDYYADYRVKDVQNSP